MIVTRWAAAQRAVLRGAAGQARRALNKRWLVLAPHPDDETLGTGALLYALADAGWPAQVVYLTDGAASHPESPSWPPGRLAGQRRREARQAVRRLGGRKSPLPIFLDWPDARPHAEGSVAFDRTADRLARLMRARRIQALATTWVGEPHGDHAAAAAVATAALRRMTSQVDLYDYVVWGWGAPASIALQGRDVIALPQTAAGAVRRREALACHRSQLGRMIADSPKGFHLPRDMVRTSATTQVLFKAPRA